MLCFRKIPVAKKVMDKRGGGIKIFRREFFVPQCRKLSTFAREPYCVVFQKKIPQRKRLWIRKGGIKIFRRKFFCLRVPKVSWGKTYVLCFRKFSVAKNSMDKRGGYQYFPSILICTTNPKTLAREPFFVVFRKTSGSE